MTTMWPLSEFKGILGGLCCLGLSAQATALTSFSMLGHVLGICQSETPLRASF